MLFADKQKEDQTVSHYKHLAIEERESLYLWINQGKSIRRIARELKRSASTLSRELSRNKISHRPYSSSRAQRRCQRCKQNCGRKPILDNKESLVLIRRLLREEWPPEEIQYRLKREENIFSPLLRISGLTFNSQSILSMKLRLCGYSRYYC